MKHELVYVNQYRVDLDYSVEANLKSFKEEVLNRLYTIHKEHAVNDLLFSGGMDSTVVLRALQELGVTPQLHSLSFSKDETDYGTLLAKKQCKKFKAKEPEFFYLDKDDFFKHIKMLTYEKKIAYPFLQGYYMDYYLSKTGDTKFFSGMCEYRTVNGVVVLNPGPEFVRNIFFNRFYGFECSETFLAFVNDLKFKNNYLKPTPIEKYGQNVWYIRDLVYNNAYPELGMPPKRGHDDDYITVPYYKEMLTPIKNMYPMHFLTKPWHFDAKDYHDRKVKND